MSNRHGSHDRGSRRPTRERVITAGFCVLCLGAFGGGAGACKAESAERGARQWVHCACSYISDFDEPGAAPIDVCTEGHAPEEIAATCARNDGVGIPTHCRCDTVPLAPCAKGDRCRPGEERKP